MVGSALSIERPGVPGAAPLRIAVVGTGGWGAQHARVVTERIDTELVAVVGRDTARTAARAARLQRSNLYHSVKQRRHPRRRPGRQ